MTVVLLVCVAMLAVAAVCVVARMTIGPTLLDRAVALDLLVTPLRCNTRCRLLLYLGARKAERGDCWHAVELTESRTPRDLGTAPTLADAIELVLSARC